MLKFLLAVAIITGSVGEVLAQQAKKEKAEKKEPQPKSKQNFPQCEGGVFLMEDGGIGPLCMRRDGKVCQLRSGSSGRAELTDCG